MNAAWPCVLALVSGTGECLAQALSDPMQPPAFAVAPGGESAPAPAALVLQSTLLSKGRRIAMIDGKPMKVGDKIGTAKIVAIDATSVTLRDSETIRVLKLYQDVEIAKSGTAEAPASRKKMPEARR
ncbi:MAG: MSHA biogenesis protein MshK [Betaproteobacteria bacterium]|nr:MSHA biogenesis protein MshK [Betaproteobacteria bacterium]